jgi:hypothetical protein
LFWYSNSDVFCILLQKAWTQSKPSRQEIDSAYYFYSSKDTQR